MDFQALGEGDTGWVRQDIRPDSQVHKIVVNGTSRISCLIKELGQMWGVKAFHDHMHGPAVEIGQSLWHVVEMLELEGMVMVDPFEVMLQEAYDYLVDWSGRVPAPMYT
ncbi:hypothetical protein CPB86DRAFT_796442 [Serendipita vermifera]|nr:hypothetical protein CPB86DRAFT_796442 [Serendipita vermifera]